jgi:hypothetical protein
VKYIRIVTAVICAVLWAGCESAVRRSEPGGVRPVDDNVIGRAFDAGMSNVQVEGEGVATRVLADDLDGSRHQRFIVRLASGQTVLIAHNIDVAPRLNDLREGDTVRFYGVYEWNEKGGTVHWTHHDPAGRHVAGWLKHKGRTYQ